MPPSSHTHFQLRPRESVRDGILRIVEVIANHPATPTPRDPSGRAKAIHETRLALKRARALVRMLRPTLGSSLTTRLNRSLRTASQRLAKARDTAAGLQRLDQLRRKRPAADALALNQVRAQFAKSSQDQEQSTAAVTQSLARARTALRSTARSLKTAPWKLKGWAIVSTGLEAGHRRARKRLRTARTSNEDAAFHAWRTACKSLFYQLALLRPISKGRLSRWIQDLDQLQDDLGRLNDLSNLTLQLSTPPAATAAPEASTASKEKAAVERSLRILQREREQLQKHTLRRGRRLLAERSPEFLERLTHAWKAWRKK
jgi:CHAD domain-containing protein